jgi:hypothetical protein
MIVTNLLTLHNQLKIHHWQTKSYAEHQALGSTYDEFADLIDEFIEYLVTEVPKGLDTEKDTDLLNIRDEMLGQLNKLKYLLTLN